MEVSLIIFRPLLLSPARRREKEKREAHSRPSVLWHFDSQSIKSACRTFVRLNPSPLIYFSSIYVLMSSHFLFTGRTDGSFALISLLYLSPSTSSRTDELSPSWFNQYARGIMFGKVSFELHFRPFFLPSDRLEADVSFLPCSLFSLSLESSFSSLGIPV